MDRGVGPRGFSLQLTSWHFPKHVRPQRHMTYGRCGNSRIPGRQQLWLNAEAAPQMQIRPLHAHEFLVMHYLLLNALLQQQL